MSVFFHITYFCHPGLDLFPITRINYFVVNGFRLGSHRRTQLSRPRRRALSPDRAGEATVSVERSYRWLAGAGAAVLLLGLTSGSAWAYRGDYRGHLHVPVDAQSGEPLYGCENAL